MTVPTPVYPGENSVVYLCGNGMNEITDPANPGESKLQLVKNTNAEEFDAYCEALSAAGCAKVFENKNASGIFRQFSGEENIYAYFITNESAARIVTDKCSVTVPEFASPNTAETCPDSALMQFGHFYSDMILGVTCDCGMCYAIRLRDNRIIIVDGGEMEQCTKIATDEFMARIEALTGNPEKIVIAAWFCTHPHDDHMDFFCHLLKEYGHRLTVEGTMFNFPSPSLMNYSSLSVRCCGLLSERVFKNNPSAKHLKLHTGQKFNISNAEIEVILTHEDILGLHTDKVYEGMNETCTVLKITVDGKSVIFLGDVHNSNGDVLIGRYPEGAVSCDFLQAAHHCINNVENIYKFIKTEYFLIPEGRYLLLKHLKNNYGVIRALCEEEKVIVAGDATTVHRFAAGEITGVEYYPVKGCAFDGSEL